jgi:hypothetical protein
LPSRLNPGSCIVHVTSDDTFDKTERDATRIVPLELLGGGQ